MPETPLKVVIVGCGGRAGAWAAVAKASTEVEIVGLVDLDRSAAQRFAQKHELEPTLIYESLDAAAKASEPDMVFDITVPSAHRAVTVEALGLGLHVLGEKPMSDNLEAGQAMVEAARKANKLYAVTQTRRPIEPMLSAREFLASQALGPLEALHCDFYKAVHFGGFRDRMAFPLILDMAVHTFDNARQLARAEPVSVYCQTWNPPHSWSAGDMNAAAIFEMRGPSGEPIVYTYRGSWVDQGLATTWEADWRCVGSKGTLRFDGSRSMQAERAKPAEQPRGVLETEPVEVPRVMTHQSADEYLIHDFVEAVRSGGQTRPMCDCQDNIKSLAMVSTAVESAKAGQKLPVRWD